MNDFMGNEIKFGDLVALKVRSTYSSSLHLGRVVSMPKNRKTIGVARLRWGRFSVATGGLRAENCVVLERSQPDIQQRISEWNEQPLNDKPNLAEWLGRSEEDVMYWAENRVNSGLD